MNGPISESVEQGPDFTPWPAEFAERYRAAGYWQGEALGEILRRGAADHSERTALVCGDRRWTYQALDARVDRVAAGLLALGLKAGDRVVLQLPNLAEFVLSVFALFRIGALPVFALPAHRRAEIAYFCEFAGARALIIADRHAGFDYRCLAREVRSGGAGPEFVLVVGEAEEFTPFTRLDAEPCSLPAPDAAALAFLQLSGGSTGRPKLIPRTHDDYFYSVRASAEICGLNASSIYLCALPVAHNFPMSSPGILGVLHAGGCVVLSPDPSPDTAFALIERERVTMSSLVPSLVLVWLDAAAGRRAMLASLQILQVGGACLAGELARRIESAFDCRLQQVFGMAEGLVNYTRLDDDVLTITGTQGRAISPDDEVRVVDDEDRDLPDGVPGHLLTRGPYTIRGYYRAAAHNARAFTRDGFYRTGDIVRRLPGGYLVVEGREKDQINRGGDKVAAEEVESHLMAHPAVLDAAVVAMPDPYLGERSCAFIVPRGDAPRGPELARFMRERGIAGFKLPDRFEFISQFPKTAVGKIDKRSLRELVIARLDASRRSGSV